MKRPCALLCNVKNEAIILPMWLSYYTKFFDVSDIYVSDDMSTDETMLILETAGITIDIIPGTRAGGKRKIKHLLEHVRQRTVELLKDYETVLFVEADEFIVPVTGNLREFLDQFVVATRTCASCGPAPAKKCYSHRLQVCKDIEIIHDIVNEPDLDLTKPIMEQRSHALNVPKFNNAKLWGSEPQWKESIHDVNGERAEVSNTLWLVHLHHVDFNLCNQRHKSRKAHVDNVAYNVEIDDELKTVFTTKLSNPGLYYNNPTIMVIPPEVKTAF